MPGRHQGDTKAFSELNFAEQAKSITAQINVVQAAIEHHVEHSTRKQETIDKCKAQIERLTKRLNDKYPKDKQPAA